MLPRLLSSWSIGVILALALLAPSRALAYEEQVAFGVDGGYTFIEDGAPSHGAGVGVSAGIGLGDTFTLTLRASYALHPGDAGGPRSERTTHVLGLSAEAIYIVDILTWVPFFGAGLDGYLVARSGVTGNVEAHAIVGIDYLHSRTLAFGLDARVGYLPFEPTEDAYRGLHVRVGFRVSYLFSTY